MPFCSNREEDVRLAQLAPSKRGARGPSYQETLKLAPLVDALPEEARLPLVDRTFPALKGLSPKQYADFRDHVEALVHADGKISSAGVHDPDHALPHSGRAFRPDQARRIRVLFRPSA